MITEMDKGAKRIAKGDDLVAEISQLGDMWDKMLSWGDDDFYEAVRHHGQKSNEEKKSMVTRRTRKRRRGI